MHTRIQSTLLRHLYLLSLHKHAVFVYTLRATDQSLQKCHCIVRVSTLMTKGIWHPEATATLPTHTRLYIHIYLYEQQSKAENSIFSCYEKFL